MRSATHTISDAVIYRPDQMTRSSARRIHDTLGAPPARGPFHAPAQKSDAAGSCGHPAARSAEAGADSETFGAGARSLLSGRLPPSATPAASLAASASASASAGAKPSSPPTASLKLQRSYQSGKYGSQKTSPTQAIRSHRSTACCPLGPTPSCPTARTPDRLAECNRVYAACSGSDPVECSGEYCNPDQDCCA